MPGSIARAIASSSRASSSTRAIEAGAFASGRRHPRSMSGSTWRKAGSEQACVKSPPRCSAWADLRVPRFARLCRWPALTSQRVAEAARAPLVARMDADDVSLPDRLEEELAVFARYPETGVVACLCDFIDTRDRKLRGSERWRLARRTPLVPFAHGAMMYRRDIFDRVGGYRRECEYWEDQDLVTRMAR